MNKIKKTISIICVSALCTGLFSACTKNDSADYATVAKGEIEQTVTETGTVKFDDEYTVTSLASGKILSANFEEGDSVKKGDILYVIDDVDLRNQIEQTEIALEKANEAKRQTKNAEGDLSLYSKTSGLVTKVYAHIGDYVTPGTPILDVVESNYMKLTVPFVFSDNSNLYAGMNVNVVMTVNGAEVSGVIERVYESTQSFDGGRRGTNVEIKVQNPGALKKGDTAYAKINGISSVSSGMLENYTDQTVVASQSGEVIKLLASEGKNISYGTLLMQVKNDSVTNSFSNSTLNVKDIETALSQLKEKLDDYVVKAPIDGVVITKTAKESDIISSGAPLAVVADTEKLYVNAEIDEMYISDIQKRQRARALLQNGEAKEYQGFVRKISDSGTEKNGVTYYNVEIELDAADGLIEGMNMDIFVITSAKENALYLPREYVNGNRVTVLTDKKPKEIEVKTGIKNDKFIEITDGLVEGEKVIKGAEA